MHGTSKSRAGLDAARGTHQLPLQLVTAAQIPFLPLAARENSSNAVSSSGCCEDRGDSAECGASPNCPCLSFSLCALPSWPWASTLYWVSPSPRPNLIRYNPAKFLKTTFHLPQRFSAPWSKGWQCFPLGSQIVVSLSSTRPKTPPPAHS